MDVLILGCNIQNAKFRIYFENCHYDFPIIERAIHERALKLKLKEQQHKKNVTQFKSRHVKNLNFTVFLKMLLGNQISESL